jgi:Tfp pilus assembly protein PilN
VKTAALYLVIALIPAVAVSVLLLVAGLVYVFSPIASQRERADLLVQRLVGALDLRRQ